MFSSYHSIYLKEKANIIRLDAVVKDKWPLNTIWFQWMLLNALNTIPFVFTDDIFKIAQKNV